MKLYDAVGVFDDLIVITYDYGMIALLLVIAVVIVAGVSLLVLRRRRRSGKK